MRPLQCNYCSTTSARQVVAGGLLYNVSMEVNDYLWLTNFRVLWAAPAEMIHEDLQLIMIDTFQSAVGCT